MLYFTICTGKDEHSPRENVSNIVFIPLCAYHRQCLYGQRDHGGRGHRGNRSRKRWPHDHVKRRSLVLISDFIVYVRGSSQTGGAAPLPSQIFQQAKAFFHSFTKIQLKGFQIYLLPV